MSVKYFCHHAGICGNNFAEAHDRWKHAKGFVNYRGCIFLNEIRIYMSADKNGTFVLTSFGVDSLNVYTNVLQHQSSQQNKRAYTYCEGVRRRGIVGPKVGDFSQNPLLFVRVECEKERSKT
jgi:hypothetical protein